MLGVIANSVFVSVQFEFIMTQINYILVILYCNYKVWERLIPNFHNVGTIIIVILA